MFARDRFEKEYKHVFEQHKTATTIWSPLCSGLLSGKYNDGNIPGDSRFKNDMLVNFIFMRYFSEEKKESTKKLLHGIADVAKDLGYTQAQLCLAWTLANNDVSTALLGFSRIEQVHENMKALELYHKWTPEIEEKIEKVLNNTPVPETNWKTFGDGVGRRQAALKK